MEDIRLKRMIDRKPLAAAVLSLALPGLGHIYCGRIVMGLVLAFLSRMFMPMIFGVFSVSGGSIQISVVILSLAASFGVTLFAIFSSWRLAKGIKYDYELKRYNHWYVYVLITLVFTYLGHHLVLNLRERYLEAFKIPTASMYPTIRQSDHVLVNKSVYNDTKPKRGDIVIYIHTSYSTNQNELYIKRVAAVAGDTIEMKNGELYLNGDKLEQRDIGRASYEEKFGEIIEGEVFLEKNGEAEYSIFVSDKNMMTDCGPFTVGEGQCFLIGDNRNFSYDSRHTGPVLLSMVRGRVEYLYLPAGDWSRAGKLR